MVRDGKLDSLFCASDLCRQAHRDQIEPTVDDLKLPRCVDCKQPAGYPASVPLFCGLHRWCVICPKPRKENGTRGERTDAQLHCTKDECTRRFDQLFPTPEQRYEAEQKYRAGTLKLAKAQPQQPRTCVECQTATAIYPPESRLYCEVHQYCIICRTKVREIVSPEWCQFYCSSEECFSIWMKLSNEQCYELERRFRTEGSSLPATPMPTYSSAPQKVFTKLVTRENKELRFEIGDPHHESSSTTTIDQSEGLPAFDSKQAHRLLFIDQQAVNSSSSSIDPS